MYGLQDEMIPKERADEVVRSVFQLFHKPLDENILKEEFVRLLESGGDLPDCEFDGHHGDEEWEVRHSLCVSVPGVICFTACLASSFIDGTFRLLLNSQLENRTDSSLKYIMWSSFIWMTTETSRNGIIQRI